MPQGPFGGNIPRLPGVGQQPQPMGGTFGGPPGGGRPGMTPPPQAAPPQGGPFAGGAPQGNPFAGGAQRPGMFGGQGAPPPGGPPAGLSGMFGARPPQPPAGAPPQGLLGAAQNNPQFADRLKQAQAAWQLRQMQPQGSAVEPNGQIAAPPVVG